jgi:outer membrane protein assembly factor BamB
MKKMTFVTKGKRPADARARGLRLLATLALVLAASACAARATNGPAGDSSAPGESARAANVGASAAPAVAPGAASEATSPAVSAAASDATSAAVSSPAMAAGEGAAKVLANAKAAAIEWPQWRGPNRDGVAMGVTTPRAWPRELKEQWRVTVGVGHASPVVSGGRIYQFARIGEEEVLLCLDAASGKELWRTSGGAIAYEMNPAARGHGKGPKSTPIVSGGRVYTLGITGVLSAHDAKTGKLAWRKEFSKEFPSTSPLYGTAMSPVVEKNLLIAHVGGHDRGALMAFDAATGAVRWRYDADGPAYSSPVVATLGGARQVFTFTQKEFVSVSAATGKLLWKLPAKTHYDTNCNSPVIYKDTVIFSLEGQGLVAVRPTRQGANWTAAEVWRNRENELYMNSPVLEGDVLYGLSVRKKGQLFAVDAATGKTLWQGPGRAGENAALILTPGALLALTNEANLVVLATGSKEYAPAAQYTVAQSQTWAHPVFMGDRILVKDETTLASYSLN